MHIELAPRDRVYEYTYTTNIQTKLATASCPLLLRDLSLRNNWCDRACALLWRGVRETQCDRRSARPPRGAIDFLTDVLGILFFENRMSTSSLKNQREMHGWRLFRSAYSDRSRPCGRPAENLGGWPRKSSPGIPSKVCQNSSRESWRFDGIGLVASNA